jgi:hypothetical protein
MQKRKSERLLNAVMATAKDGYHGIGTPENPATKIEDGALYVSAAALNTMEDVPGYILLYYGPSPDASDFRGVAAYYIKKAEYFSGDEGANEGKQLRLDADHSIYGCFFLRNKRTGELIKAQGILRLKGRAARAAALGYDDFVEANYK